MSANRARAMLAVAAAMALAGCGGGNTDFAEGGSNEPTAPLTPKGWELVWSDEFDGSALDTANWNIQLGDGTAEGIPGWGNNELQNYAAGNVTVAGGNLIITALADGDAYTSGRINTAGKFDFRYGRVEASIHPPAGQGLWSAFWMLPTDSAYGTWAAGGEIDIMEVFSRDPEPFTQAVLHYGMAWPLNVYSALRYTGIDPSDGPHVYAVEWDADEIRWFIDGVHYHTITKLTYWSYYRDAETNAHRSGGDAAPFDQPFHLLLNVAVGGNLPGAPVPEAFPGEMRVDYVRVYQCNIDFASGVGCSGFADLVSHDVTPPPLDDVWQTTYELYGDVLGPLTFGDTEDDPLVDLHFGVYDNGGALVLAEVVGDGDQGMVLDVHTTGGGNFSIHAADLSRQTFFGMGSATARGNYGGELQFDLHVFAEGTDPDSALQVKIDSGFPDLGFVELPISELPKDDWTTVTVQVSDIAHSPGHYGGGPVDLDNVLSLFVLEPTGAAHVQVDNLRILCGHPDDNGCGIRPPVPVTPGTAEPQDVFVDAVDPLWDLGILGADSGSGWANYADGTDPANKAQWAVISAADTDRGQIIEVSFSDSTEFGVWFIQASTGVDLRQYATGSVNFDIKVDDYGTSTGMTMKIDCIFPCTSGDQPIGKVGDGAWETVSIPVPQLTGGGLNLTTVNTGIVIFPTDQSVAVTFQLDNVRWLAGEPPEPGGGGGEARVLYDDAIADGWFLWDCCGGATFAEVADDDEHGNVVELRFGPGGTVTGFNAVEGVDMSDLVGGTLTFDFKEVAPPPAGSVWRLKLESSNAATAVEVLLTDAGNPTPSSDWQSYRFALDTDLAGLDISDLKLVMFFPDWANADGAVGRIDNVIFEPAP